MLWTMKNNSKRIGRSFYLLLGSLLANLQNLRFIGYGMLEMNKRGVSFNSEGLSLFAMLEKLLT